MEKSDSVFRGFFYTSLGAQKKSFLDKTKSHLALKFPGKRALLHVPPTGHLWREMLRLQSQ
jgi:hypothetical protein